MSYKINPLISEELCKRYIAGEPEYLLAKEIGVDRDVIRRILRENNIPRCSRSEVTKIRMRNLTSDERKALTQNSHKVTRGIPQPIDRKIKSALMHEITQSRASSTENILADSLRKLGMNIVTQKAVYIYNLDIAFWTLHFGHCIA